MLVMACFFGVLVAVFCFGVGGFGLILGKSLILFGAVGVLLLL
jgi:hypothetical protein